MKVRLNLVASLNATLIKALASALGYNLDLSLTSVLLEGTS
jgi:hypothetical protein